MCRELEEGADGDAYSTEFGGNEVVTPIKHILDDIKSRTGCQVVLPQIDRLERWRSGWA